ncbi:MAG: hypothetical protein U0793_14965 [Gemmataceae bacterium]
MTLLIPFTFLAAAAPAAEPWADPALRPAKGLILWLDAARQPAAWKANGKPTLENAAPFDVFYDASGHRLHFTQRLAASQPRFLSKGDSALVRFDGKDDFLGAALRGLTPPGSPAKLDEFTLFLVAIPRSNRGAFEGFFASHETGKNDYVTGFNVDMNYGVTPTLSQLNVEGKGFGGAVNLLKKPRPFGQPFVIEVHGDSGAIRLFIDGVAEGQRKRGKGPISLDALVLGARCYSNSKDPPFIQGFLDGDIAEVLLYDRILTDDEIREVRARLLKTASRLKDAFPATPAAIDGHLPTTVADPPLVQMLVPGFTVHELPLDLKNINNLRYRPDGKLVALGYDGNIWLLSDTDGDGLEDKAELFWDNKGRLISPIGMALTPPGYKLGEGVFVASKGKVSLIVDTDGDGKADKEIVVASGWKPLPVNVDALGVALDKDGAIYFGLGTADYANAYLKDKDGKGHFDIKSERGTIQKVSADFKKRETVCTGIRFPVGMAFNRLGDLFCTDQEGATWLPNGNPFDELLHIQPGRHYGFPPRHPKWLPDVVDEPSVFDYGPQHQSTCGLVFNEPVLSSSPRRGGRGW